MSEQELMSTKTGEIVADQEVSQSQRLMTNIVQAACDPSYDVTKMENMYNLHSRIQADEAEKAYFRDKALMQAELPLIPKNGKGQGDAPFVKYEDAIKLVGPVFGKYGFSYSSPVKEFNGNEIIVTGILSHKGGHKEITELPLPRDTGGQKNAVQAVGSTLSYARRYCLFALANIAAEGDDDDGKSTGAPENKMVERYFAKVKAQNEALRGCLQEVYEIQEALKANDYDTAADLISQLGYDVFSKLRVAPTRGGIFTVEEKDKLKSSEFEDAFQPFNNEEWRDAADRATSR